MSVDRSALDRATPVFLASGVAALVARRLDASGQATPTLHDAARAYAITDMQREMTLRALAAVFRDGGVQVVLFKGWAAAQSYAATELRPSGDFDLLVRPADAARVRALLAPHVDQDVTGERIDELVLEIAAPWRGCTLDLHMRLPPSYGLDVEDVVSRAVPGAGPWAGMLVPGAEDHLRIVIVHLLKHGAWRPLWLCDVAAMVEGVSSDFDWPLFLGSERTCAAWLRATIGVAHRLLGCRVDHLPEAFRADASPAWIAHTILREWENPDAALRRLDPNTPIRDVRAYLAARWPSPIEATFASAGPDARVRWRFQASHVLRHGSRKLRERRWWKRLM